MFLKLLGDLLLIGVTSVQQGQHQLDLRWLQVRFSQLVFEKIYLFFASSDMSRRKSNPLGDLFVARLGVLLLIGNQFEKRIDFGHLCTCQFRSIFGNRISKDKGTRDLQSNFQTLFAQCD